MSKRKPVEREGDSMGSTAAFTRSLLSVAEQVHRMEHLLGRLDEQDIFVRGFRITPPNGDKPDWMLVVTADTPEGAVVAFHGEATLFDLLRTGFARLENGSLKWREDQYRK